MIGAITGDIVGSRFEWNNIKTKEFDFFHKRCRFTDDTVMTIAIAEALLDFKGNYEVLPELVVKSMQKYGRKYPNAGYGGMFRKWLVSDNPEPYHSFGNGSAMRVSPCGIYAKTLDEAERLATITAEVTHNHPEGIKGARAIAAAIFMAKSGSTKDEIREYITENYYDIDFDLASIRDNYSFDVSCQGSVPQALEAFFESNSFEDAIRNAISIGGDSDTIGAMTGSIAEPFYKAKMDPAIFEYLDENMIYVLSKFYKVTTNN